MGKYMKKSKITGDVAVMEVSLSSHCSLGVRTRAKTLALQRQQQQEQHSDSPSVVPDPDEASFSYLQLRSRRLEKPPLFKDPVKQNQQSPPGKGCSGGNPKFRNSRLRVGSLETMESFLDGSVEKLGLGFERDRAEDGCDLGLEASFGENNLEFEGRDRSTRESTPCSLIRQSDALVTPGSTTRRTYSSSANRTLRNDMQRNIPTAQEMEEFFAFAEKQQQRIFIEKYNFDIVNDLPLPGKFDWVQVTP
ncbi:hypothetical protein UlMin_031843 [Ulmus minor]